MEQAADLGHSQALGRVCFWVRCFFWLARGRCPRIFASACEPICLPFRRHGKFAGGLGAGLELVASAVLVSV